MRFLFVISLVFLAMLSPVQAQSEDRSRLIRFLEDSLSDGAARQVRIEGFAGALSSTATLDRLTIADADGIWLTIEGAELTWRRAGLLSGEVDITRLGAERIVLERFPLAEDNALPAPEATPFALPELPVSIRIAALQADRIDLGAAVLGFAVSATLDGSVDLAGGEGAIALDLARIDGPEGVFALAARYANATGQLALDLDLREDPGGIAVALLNIPDAPSVDLSIAGEGPLTDLATTIALATDGIPRLGGDVVISETENGAQRLTVDIAGDVAGIFAPDYRPFFGDDIRLDAVATRQPEGALSLQEMAIETASLSLTGMADLAPGGAPDRFDVALRIRPATDGTATVRLPVPGQVVTLAGADFDLSYDRASGEAWQGTGEIRALSVDELRLERAALDMSGQITSLGNMVTGVTAAVQASYRGLAPGDPALAEALGPAGQAGFDLAWRDGGPVRLDALRVTTGTAELRGSATVAAAMEGVELDLELEAMLPDLGRFAGLAGADLSGAATAGLTGRADLLAGSFDLAIDAATQDLGLGAGVPPGLLRGETRLTGRVIRDEGGLRAEAVDLTGEALRAEGHATLTSAASELDLTARLADAGLFSAALSGPLDLTARLARQSAEAPWDLEARAALAGNVSVLAAGQVGLPGGAVDVDITGTAALALANPFITPRSVQGQAALDLRLAGAPGLAALGGRVTVSGARIAAPNLGLAVEAVSADVTLRGGRADVTGQGQLATGGALRLSGGLDLLAAGFPGRVDVTLTEARVRQGDFLQTVISSAAIAIDGPLARGPSVSGEVILGQTDISVTAEAFGTAEPIPEIRHLGENAAQRATRAAAGLLQPAGSAMPAMPLDLSIVAANRIFLRGSGLDAELGGAIRVGGTSANVIPSGQFDLIRGRLSLAGQRFDLVEGSVTLQGDFDPYLRLVASTQAGDTQVQIALTGPAHAPELALSSQPSLPEDEILARILFGRGVSSLSAVQAIQLVDGLSRLAGSGSIIGGIRESLGIADLDLTTDEAGNAELRVGRYIGENAYTDIGIGSDGGAEVSINLDLTPNLTARGTLQTDGQGALGVFFERDY